MSTSSDTVRGASAPHRIDEPAAGAHGMRRDAAFGHEPLRVLVAEDDFEMRRMIVRSLRRHGCEVIEAKTGAEMLDVLASELLHPAGNPPVDLIISDFHMPGVTGLSVLAGLRDAEWQTPFILITAFGGPEVRDEALRDGASAYFSKPFDLDELEEKVLELAAPDGAAATHRRCAASGGWHQLRVDALAPERCLCLACLDRRELGGGQS